METTSGTLNKKGSNNNDKANITQNFCLSASLSFSILSLPFPFLFWHYRLGLSILLCLPLSVLSLISFQLSLNFLLLTVLLDIVH